MAAIQLSNVRRAMPPMSIPPGKYEGTWSSNQVRFQVGDQGYVADSPTSAPRGTPCLVRVSRGVRGTFKATVEAAQ